MRRIQDLPDAHLRIFDRPTLPREDALADVYLIGICGTGMGSLAGLFREAGYVVRGSDAAAWPPMSTRLATLGIPVYEGYDAGRLDPPPDLVVVGNACTPTHVEAARARDEGLVQTSLPEALARYFIRDRTSLVVAGTHGKTTTTSLLVHVLRTAGIDPGFLVGGVMRNGDVSYGLGEGSVFITEGDEYDSAYFDKRPKFLHYRPTHAIVTSVEFDHADIYETWTDYRDAFREFSQLVNPAGSLVLNADDPEVLALARHTGARVVTYGLAAADLDFTAGSIRSEGDGQRFTLLHRGKESGSYFLPMSGRHNLGNALSVCAVALGLGVTPDSLREGLLSFAGIRRRQEIRGEVNQVTVIDDFAHHPTAVRATIDAIRERWPERRLVAVFEPRSNSSRRKVFEEGYVAAFDRANAVFLSTPPFRHNDRAEDFMDIDRVTDALERRGIHTALGRDADELLPALLSWIEPGDVVLIMSNGGFGNIHARLLSDLTNRSGN